MKKHILTILVLVFCMTLVLTGCATVGNVVDKNGKPFYTEEIIYNQGQVLKINNYLYYGNAFFDAADKSFDYNESAKTGYLARIDIDKDFTFKSDVDNDLLHDTSPNNIEKVNGKLAGYDKQDMFALGSYIYFTSANTHKTTSHLANDYSQVSLFRVKYNGDGFQEIDTFRTAANTIRKVCKGSDENYYYIVYTIDGDEVYNLYSIKLGDNLGKTKTLVKDVKSVALCDEDSTDRKIYFTVDDAERGTPAVKAVDFATEQTTPVDKCVVDSETILQGRVGDYIFYSYKTSTGCEIYYKDIVNDDEIFDDSNKFYTADNITNIRRVGNGVMFEVPRSGSIMYKASSEEVKPILRQSEYGHVLFTSGDFVYYSNSDGIGRINVMTASGNIPPAYFLTKSNIRSGYCGFTGDYIYFYAQLEPSDDESSTNDTNYYMYQSDMLGNYQLIGKTK